MPEVQIAIPWYKSNTLRALLLAAVAQVASILGLTDDLAPRAEQIADSILALVELGALAWAGYARIKQPTPPIMQPNPPKVTP